MSATEIYNPSWFDENSKRNYPFVDQASLVDADGRKLPTDIVVGTSIWVLVDSADFDTPIWTNLYGSVAYLSAISVTPKLVTAVISLGDEFGGDQVIGHITVPRPLDPGASYPMTMLRNGDAGWITFGFGANEDENLGHWRFDDRDASAFLGDAVTAYIEPGIYTGVGTDNSADVLNGVVEVISGSSDLKIEKRNLYLSLGGTTRFTNALVFSLNTDTFGNSLYTKYIGPCDGQHETGTCGFETIYAINGVTPDENGQIIIRFRESGDDATLNLGGKPTVEPHDTAVVSYAVKLSDICGARQLPSVSDEGETFDTCSPDPGEVSAPWLLSNEPLLEFLLDDANPTASAASTGSDTGYSVEYEISDPDRYRAGRATTSVLEPLCPLFTTNDRCSIPGIGTVLNVAEDAGVSLGVSVRQGNAYLTTLYQTILHFGNDDGGLHIYAYGNRVYAVVWDSLAASAYVTATLVSHVPTQIVVTINNTAVDPELSLYVNGSLEDAAVIPFTGDWATTSLEMIIGEHPSVQGLEIDDEFGDPGAVATETMTHSGMQPIASFERTNGLIGCLRIWDRTLSETDVATYYAENG